MPTFTVDDDNPGTDEADWLSSPRLASIPPLVLPKGRESLVVAPHPDDEVLGAGGLLQTLGRRAEIEVWAVTDGERSDVGVPAEDLRRIRTEESLTALSRLGLSAAPRMRLSLPDGSVADHEAELTDRLAGRLSPDSVCFAPWEGDGHPDHDACGRAARTAASTTGASLVRYLVWAWHWAAPESGEVPWSRCRRWRLSERHTRHKTSAIEAFASQIEAFGGSSCRPVLPPTVVERFRRPFEVFVI